MRVTVQDEPILAYTNARQEEEYLVWLPAQVSPRRERAAGPLPQAPRDSPSPCLPRRGPAYQCDDVARPVVRPECLAGDGVARRESGAQRTL